MSKKTSLTMPINTIQSLYQQPKALPKEKNKAILPQLKDVM